jgi:choline dehydrogenase-like flavoprotein
MAGSFDGTARTTEARSTAEFDLVVLGAGSGGYACALRAAQLGLAVGLVEQDKVGGTCLHRGCIPTKAMLHAAEVADSVRNGSEFGIHAAIDKIDLVGVVSYAGSVVTRVYKGLAELINSGGITVLQGAGRLTEANGRPVVRVVPALAAGRRGRRREDPEQRARAPTGPTASVGNCAGRRSDRSRIRVDMAVIRR